MLFRDEVGIEEKVEVTDATTWETVMVVVDVDVVVRVTVLLSEESCARASRGSRSATVKLERCISNADGPCVGPDWRKKCTKLRCDKMWAKYWRLNPFAVRYVSVCCLSKRMIFYSATVLLSSKRTGECKSDWRSIISVSVTNTPSLPVFGNRASG